uniref:Uncharacterized protein n=1 Tax=Rhizophora mucronata TaxID=61149 RepID=A0A2P2P4G2_RHIMU
MEIISQGLFDSLTRQKGFPRK